MLLQGMQESANKQCKMSVCANASSVGVQSIGKSDSGCNRMCTQ